MAVRILTAIIFLERPEPSPWCPNVERLLLSAPAGQFSIRPLHILKRRAASLILSEKHFSKAFQVLKDGLIVILPAILVPTLRLEPPCSLIFDNANFAFYSVGRSIRPGMPIVHSAKL
jgi:hypothetical protein